MARGARSDGRNYETWKIWSQKYHADRRALHGSALSTLKLEAGCADCGYNQAPESLDFDHVRGTKSFSVGQWRTSTLEKVLEEIDKCEIVCANCHRIRTQDRRVLTWEVG